MGDVVDDATSGDGEEPADGLGSSVGAVVGVNDRDGPAFAGEGGEVLEVVHAAPFTTSCMRYFTRAGSTPVHVQNALAPMSWRRR